MLSIYVESCQWKVLVLVIVINIVSSTTLRSPSLSLLVNEHFLDCSIPLHVLGINAGFAISQSIHASFHSSLDLLVGMTCTTLVTSNLYSKDTRLRTVNRLLSTSTGRHEEVCLRLYIISLPWWIFLGYGHSSHTKLERFELKGIAIPGRLIIW